MSDEALISALAAGRHAADPPMATVRDAAVAAGLVDVAYATFDSPVGPLLLAATPAGLVRVGFARHGEDALLADLAARLSPRIMRVERRLDGVRRQLDEYFHDRRRAFDLPLDLSLARGFRRAVLEHTATVPFGAVTTYRRVAEAAGSPRGYRAAGQALGANPVCIVIPCHRVLASDGGLGGYAGGLDVKRSLLAIEGRPGEDQALA